MIAENEKILARVRGLLAKAEDPACTPEEAEAFSAKAEQLIAKYAVDVALLEAKAEHRGAPTLRKYPSQDPYGKPKVTLLTGIAVTHSCKTVRHTRDNSTTVFGYQSDLDLVDLLYTSLLLQAQNALNHAPRGDRSFRTSFWYGFASRVYQRLEEAKRTAETTSEPGTALVLRDRMDDVSAAVREAFPRLRSSSAGRVSDRSGYYSGQAAANRADLGGTRLAGTRRAIS